MKYDIIRRDIFKMHFVLYKIMYNTNYFVLCISRYYFYDKLWLIGIMIYLRF